MCIRDRNSDDEMVELLLKRLTFLPLDEIAALCAEEGAALNEAKRTLAFELTKMVHGEATAKEAEATAKALFTGTGSTENMDTYRLKDADVGQTLLDVLTEAGLFPSKSEGRRLINQGGVQFNGERVDDPFMALEKDLFDAGEAIVRRGKKVHLKLLLP